MRAIGEHVVVKVKKQEKISEGGIVLPDSHIADHTEATVISIGKGFKYDLREGDTIFMSKFAGRNNIMKDGSDDTIRVVTEKEILGVVE